MYRLPDITEPFEFPNDFATSPEGLLALGGNLHPLTLVSAYSKGIFPWFNPGDPLLWWHPEPRLIFFPDKVKVSRKIRAFLKRCSGPNSRYTLTVNHDFAAVIRECADKRGKERTSTWITETMMAAYIQLYDMGFAHSVEVWNTDKKLVGGIYGIALGKAFFGESMFSHESNTSKLAFFFLCDLLVKNDFMILDGQVESPHLKSLGGVCTSRQEFRAYLKKAKTQLKTKTVFVSTAKNAV